MINDPSKVLKYAVDFCMSSDQRNNIDHRNSIDYNSEKYEACLDKMKKHYAKVPNLQGGHISKGGKITQKKNCRKKMRKSRCKRRTLSRCKRRTLYKSA